MVFQDLFVFSFEITKRAQMLYFVMYGLNMSTHMTFLCKNFITFWTTKFHFFVTCILMSH